MGRKKKGDDEKNVRITCYVKPSTAVYLDKAAAGKKPATTSGKLLARIADRLAEKVAVPQLGGKK